MVCYKELYKGLVKRRSGNDWHSSISWRCDTFTRVLYICWLCNKEYNDKQQAVGYICSRGVSYAHHTGTKQREAQ